MLFDLVGGILQEIDDGKIANKHYDSSDNGSSEIGVVTDADFILKHHSIDQYSEAHIVTGDSM